MMRSTSFMLGMDILKQFLWLTLGLTHRQSARQSFTPEKLAGLNDILRKRVVFSPEDIKNIAAYFKLQESKCRLWFKEHGARLRRQSCSVRILPAHGDNSSVGHVLKVKKRPSIIHNIAQTKAAQKASLFGEISNKSVVKECSAVKSDFHFIIPQFSLKGLQHNLKVKSNCNYKDLKKENAFNTSAEATAAKLEINEIMPEKSASLNVEASESSMTANINVNESSTNAHQNTSPLNVTTKITRTRNIFFCNLPYDQQIMLLRCTEDLTYANSTQAQELAAKLNLPFKNVYGWLKSRCVRNIITSEKRVIRDIASALNDEFNLSDEITEERALMLGYELNVSVSTIRKWFERKKNNRSSLTTERQKCVADDELVSCNSEEITHSDLGDAYVCNNVASTSPALHAKCGDSVSISEELSEQSTPIIALSDRSVCTNVDANVRTSKLPSKSMANDTSTIKRQNRIVLSEQQRTALIQQFIKTPNISDSDSHALARELNLPVEGVEVWFRQKRFRAEKRLKLKSNDEQMQSADTNHNSSEECEIME